MLLTTLSLVKIAALAWDASDNRNDKRDNSSRVQCDKCTLGKFRCFRWPKTLVLWISYMFGVYGSSDRQFKELQCLKFYSVMHNCAVVLHWTTNDRQTHWQDAVLSVPYLDEIVRLRLPQLAADLQHELDTTDLVASLSRSDKVSIGVIRWSRHESEYSDIVQLDNVKGAKLIQQLISDVLGYEWFSFFIE